MTDKKKQRSEIRKDVWQSSPPYIRETYEDGSGIPRVVLIPQGEKDKATGIPLSLDLTPLYGHMPLTFQQALTKALHDHGLIEPLDFFKTGAADRYQRVIRDVIKHDFLDIQNLAKQEIKNG